MASIREQKVTDLAGRGRAQEHEEKHSESTYVDNSISDHVLK